MRVAVMGAGAVGGYFGAKLAAAGHEVAFIARGSNLAALESAGLRIAGYRGSLHVKDALFTDSPEKAGAVDVVLFCVKSYDTESAGSAMAPLIGARTRIVSLQNGIDNPGRLARVWGAERVLAGIVYIGAQMIEPGVIAHTSGGRIVMGQENGAVDTGTEAIARTLVAADIPCEVSTDIGRAQWRKLLWNAPFCALSCLTRATVEEIVRSASLVQLATDCMAEVAAAAAVDGIMLAPEWVEETLAFSRALGPFKPSMLQDLEAGKPLEYEAFNGTVVRLLRRAGKDAPVNQVFYSTLGHIDKQLRAHRIG